MRRLLPLFAAIMLLAAPSLAANWLTNGDFETGLDGWSLRDGPGDIPNWGGSDQPPAQIFDDLNPLHMYQGVGETAAPTFEDIGAVISPPAPKAGKSVGWARTGYKGQGNYGSSESCSWVSQYFTVQPGRYRVEGNWDVIAWRQDATNDYQVAGVMMVFGDEDGWVVDFYGNDNDIPDEIRARKTTWNHQTNGGQWVNTGWISSNNREIKTYTGLVEIRLVFKDSSPDDHADPLYCNYAAFDNASVELILLDAYELQTTIDGARKAPAMSPVGITAVVTSVFRSDDGAGNTFPDSFTTEEADRSSGIRVVWNGEVAVGDEVDVRGYTGEPPYHPGERVINATGANVLTSGNDPADPFSIAGIDTGGGTYGYQAAVVNDAAANKYAVGMNNVGILMKIVGKVTQSYIADPLIPKFSDYFYVDDAYGDPIMGIETGLKDGSGDIGIKCRPPVGVFGTIGEMPAVGDFVEVLGVMGVRQIDGKNARYFWTVGWNAAGFDTFTKNHVAKWSLLSLPCTPKFADPAIVFGSEVMPDPDKIDGRLYRWDAPTQSLGMYDMWSPDLFGAMSSSEGYWLNAALAGTISYTGYTETEALDRWISAPTGWKLMGNPFVHNTWWENWDATDGTAMKSISDASQYGDGWMQSIGYWWNDSTQSLSDLGLPDDFPQSEQLNTWYGYWVKTNRNLGLVAPEGSIAP